MVLWWSHSGRTVVARWLCGGCEVVVVFRLANAVHLLFVCGDSVVVV